MRNQSPRRRPAEDAFDLDFEFVRQEHVARAACLPPMAFTQAVYAQATADLNACEPEVAGILLGPQNAEPLATHWVLDRSGRSTGVSFTLNVESLNDVLRRFRQCDLTCVGIIHSHPRGMTTPSLGDLAYLEDLFFGPTNEELDRFLFPIFCDGRLYPYIVWRRQGRLVVTPSAMLFV